VRLVQRQVGNSLANTTRLLNRQRQILPLYTRSCHQQAGRRMARFDPLTTLAVADLNVQNEDGN
jgi:hypothetical protein